MREEMGMEQSRSETPEERRFGKIEDRIGAVEIQVAKFATAAEHQVRSIDKLVERIESTSQDRTKIVLLEARISALETAQAQDRKEMASAHEKIESLNTIISQGKAVHWVIQTIIGALGGIGGMIGYMKATAK